MNILFVDNACHRKTKSAEFFLEVIRQQFEVTEHYYDRVYDTGAASAIKGHDTAIIWEFPISRGRFFFPGKRNVFVPMYDNEWGSVWQWRRIAWSGMGVISFCDKVSEHARRCGVKNLLDVRYFPDPQQFPQDLGDSKKVFLWERGGVTREMAEMLFPPSAGYTFVVKGAQDFLPREQYLKLLASCGIVIAPRKKEGIGMAFLEAMAMGKCVVAYNDATMNEYIRHGETGILFDPAHLGPVDFTMVERIRKNLPRFAAEKFGRWQNDEQKINGFLENQPICSPCFFDRLKILLACPLYLVEGTLYRLIHG